MEFLNFFINKVKIYKNANVKIFIYSNSPTIPAKNVGLVK